MPPKRKKSAKKNLAKLSPEERALLQEQQLLKEEQAKKQREELLSQFLKEKLMKEEKAMKHNTIRILSLWRDIMRKVKVENIRRELGELSLSFEKQVDRKDSLIASLKMDLELSEEQQLMRMRKYAESIDELTALQEQRIGDLEEAFDEELDRLQAEFDEERSSMIEVHTKELSDEADIRFCVRTRFSKEMETEQADFQLESDELKNRNLEDKHSLRMTLEQQLSEMWEEFRKTTKAYQENTQERRQQFEALKERDAKTSVEIQQQGRKLKWLEGKIEDCQRQLKATSALAGERQKMLRKQKETLLSQYQDMKGYMTQFSQTEMKRLKRLCSQSEACIAELEEKLKLGDQVLEMAECCRRFESEEEKVLPFYQTEADKDQDLASATATVEVLHIPADLKQNLGALDPLEGFWKRFNKVKLEEMAATREVDMARSRNHELKGMLKQYLEGISVSSDVLDRTNPLVVVTQRAATEVRQRTGGATATVPLLRGGAGRVVVIEAAQAVKTMMLA